MKFMLWLDEFGHEFWYAALQVLLLYIMCSLLHFCGVSYALLRGQLSTKQAFYQHFRQNGGQKRRLSRTFDVYLQQILKTVISGIKNGSNKKKLSQLYWLEVKRFALDITICGNKSYCPI